MILITAPVHHFFLDTLSKKGIDFLYEPTMRYPQLLEKVHLATGLVVSTQIKIDKNLIDKATHLKWIGRLGSGMEHIDVAYAKSKNIICESSPEGNCNAVAELALGLLLNFYRNINTSVLQVREKQWRREENRGTEISGKTIGIIGYGHTGSAFAKLLSAFNVTILAYDKYKTGFGNEYVTESTEDELIKYADVISFHLPLTSETQHYASVDFFLQLKKQPIIINTSRGSVIDSKALINAIQNNFISGALLDVLENEKLDTFTSEEQRVFETLNNFNNVLITPHIAGYSHEATYKMSKVLLEKLGII
jgi:D-3-phosphoglycerate dehydrogenase